MKTCSICGTEYKYCNNCKSDMCQPRWKFLFDKENCKNIWEIINGYKTYALDANAAKKALDKCDTSKLTPNVRKTIKAINANARQMERQKKEPEVAPSVDTVEPVVHMPAEAKPEANMQ